MTIKVCEMCEVVWEYPYNKTCPKCSGDEKVMKTLEKISNITQDKEILLLILYLYQDLGYSGDLEEFPWLYGENKLKWEYDE